MAISIIRGAENGKLTWALRVDLLVVLLEALPGHNTSRHRVLAEHRGHAAYLVVALLGSLGPEVAVSVPRLHLLGTLVPVEFETFLRRGEVGSFLIVEERRLAGTWCHSPVVLSEYPAGA